MRPGSRVTDPTDSHVQAAARLENRQTRSRAIEAALDGEPQAAPFHVLVRQAQREMLRLVPPQEGGPDRMSRRATGRA